MIQFEFGEVFFICIVDQNLGKMDVEVGKDYSPLWNLFHQIIHDMKNGTPLWEDFISKATKLHSALKSALLAVAAYLDTFQKIADAATNARGATKEIGTALTRVCLRHRAIETRMKTFISTLMESLIVPLTEKTEEWRKWGSGGASGAAGREHARECKRLRAELRRRALDAARARKKARKSAATPDQHRRIDAAIQDVNERKLQLEEMEEKAVLAALVEERNRFCQFVTLLNPVVESEVAMLGEVGHLQEGAGQLQRHTTEPHTLPPASYQVISDLKALSTSSGWEPSVSPTPHSPSPSLRALGGLGSRKSSLCSISSLNSSSSGSQLMQAGAGLAMCSTPTSSSSSGGVAQGHTAQRSLSQTVRLCSVSSRDSGFTSQDTLHLPPLPEGYIRKASDNNSLSSASASASVCTTPVAAPDDTDDICSNGDLGNGASSTWPDLKDTAQFERAASAIMSNRPHTISTAYEKGHPRAPLTVHTFSPGSDRPPLLAGSIQSVSQSQPVSPAGVPRSPNFGGRTTGRDQNIYARPPLPMRCSSLERPVIPAKGPNSYGQGQGQEYKTPKPSSLPPHLTKEMTQATYVNMSELANMAASRAHAGQHGGDALVNCQTAQHTHDKVCEESSASESSLESSSGYGSQGLHNDETNQQQAHPHAHAQNDLSLESERESLSAARESLSISLGSLEEAVRCLEVDTSQINSFATISKTKPSIPKKRPLSLAGVGRGASRRCSSSSLGAGKPLPPVRRSSSISRTNNEQSQYSHYQSSNQYQQQSQYQQQQSSQWNQYSVQCDADNLPPPPAFLLNPDMPTNTTPGQGINVAETVKALTELKHTPASPHTLRRAIQQNQNPPQSMTMNQQKPQMVQSQFDNQAYSSFQHNKVQLSQSQSANVNVNPIYGTTGHNRVYGQNSRKNSLTASTSDIYRELSDLNKSSSPNSSPSYSDNSFSSFGRNVTRDDSVRSGESPYGTTGFKMAACQSQQEKKHGVYGGNSIYAQPSQIIAGFNNIALGNRANESLSPLAMRKTIAARSQSADRRASDFGIGSSPSINSGSGSGLIAALSAKLAPQLSPRTTRRVTNVTHSTHQHGHQRQTKAAVAHTAGVQAAFLDKLSATIQHQRRQLQHSTKANSVRQTINATAQPDPRICHGSLMEQIKRGATLKRNKHCDDRSAPKIR